MIEKKDGDFPTLVNQINDDLLHKLVKVLAPGGFHKHKMLGTIATRQHLFKKDIEDAAQIVYDFCHNERVKLLREIENLHSHLTKEKEELAGKINLELSKPFYRRKTDALIILRHQKERTSAKILMLEFLFNVVNR